MRSVHDWTLRIRFFFLSMASQQFGRFWFSLTDVLAVARRTGLTGLIRPGFDVHLRGGVRLRLTPSEKEMFDDAMTLHAQTLHVMGIIKEAQTSNRR